MNNPKTCPASATHEDPHGFSGSLVWNTQYVEKSATGAEWSPDDAVITGLLQWHIPERKTVVALRVEHIRTWLSPVEF
jgi:hypothetical protein